MCHDTCHSPEILHIVQISHWWSWSSWWKPPRGTLQPWPSVHRWWLTSISTVISDPRTSSLTCDMMPFLRPQRQSLLGWGSRREMLELTDLLVITIKLSTTWWSYLRYRRRLRSIILMSRGEIVLEVSRSIYLFMWRSKVMGIPSGPRTSYINDIKCHCSGTRWVQGLILSKIHQNIYI